MSHDNYKTFEEINLRQAEELKIRKMCIDEIRRGQNRTEAFKIVAEKTGQAPRTVELKYYRAVR